MDVAAPGTYILSTATNHRYSYMTGTSMATPFVTAIAAMVYAKNENMSIQTVRKAILDTVTPLPYFSTLVS